MREDDLKRVLLVAAVEEADREGTLLPTADRENAAREARRSAGAGAGAEMLLAHRAAPLHARIVQRHPFVADVEAHASGIAGVGAVVIGAGFLAGFALSALDGTRRVNVLAYPLAGLVAWNLLVYAWVLVAALRAKAGPRRGGWLAESAAALAARRLAGFVARSRAFHAQLAEALTRFAQAWQAAARPVLVARASRTFHLAAAAVGVGLIAGLYLRGIAFDYRAGWASTFLDASGARAVAAVLYAPASWITGIAIPDAAHFEAIRWKEGGGGGEPAARWIHLLAASALVLVVLPRLLLAIAATFGAMRAARTLELPPAARTHARHAFGAFGGMEQGLVRVLPYAYDPDATARARVGRALERDLGQGLSLEVAPAVAYGGEREALGALTGTAMPAAVVALVNLASTPEDENHGRFLEGIRDAYARSKPDSPLLVLVDEGPYLGRMGGGPRVEERRRAWDAFATARGLQARFVDLRT